MTNRATRYWIFFFRETYPNRFSIFIQIDRLPHSHAYESNYIFGTPSGKADREGRGNWRYDRILREMKLQLGAPRSENSSYFFMTWPIKH